jgi:CHAT domain-containing protein
VISASLPMLPRLPETAAEVREIAVSLGADVEKDVFSGPAASEAQIKTMDLSDRRILVFATHGLMPGDIDGLHQPAWR